MGQVRVRRARVTLARSCQKARRKARPRRDGASRRRRVAERRRETACFSVLSVREKGGWVAFPETRDWKRVARAASEGAEKPEATSWVADRQRRARTSTAPWACIPSAGSPRGPPWSAARRRCRAPRPRRRRASPGDRAWPPRRSCGSCGGAHRRAGTNRCARCAIGARSTRTRRCSCSPGREFEPRGRRRRRAMNVRAVVRNASRQSISARVTSRAFPLRSRENDGLRSVR